MLGLIIQFILSYLIIYWAEKGNLSFMGLKPDRKRIQTMIFFLLLAGLCSSVTFLLRMKFGQERWELNPNLGWKLLGEGIWYNIKSVLYEELIFRGILFYLLIKKLGSNWALWISASAFGIYHLFSYEVFNEPVKMLWIFLITASAGIIYGMAYLRTGSLLTPIGMHFGWNFVNSFVFSNSNIGSGILVEHLPQPEVNVSYFIYYMITFGHLMLFFLLNFLMLKMRKNAFE